MESIEDMMATVESKYVPQIKALGAESVTFLTTGPDTMHIVTTYPDEQTATAAREKIEAVREAAAADEEVGHSTMISEVRGKVLLQA